MEKIEVIVTNGKYSGRQGFADYSITKKTGNVMFYSKEGSFPYRTVLNRNDVKRLE
jgi:hypothetical protein